jgi:hypothetical protein
VLRLSEPVKWRVSALATSPYNLVIHALKFSDLVARIQRAFAASFGGTPRLLSKLAYQVAADGIVLGIISHMP